MIRETSGSSAVVSAPASGGAGVQPPAQHMQPPQPQQQQQQQRFVGNSGGVHATSASAGRWVGSATSSSVHPGSYSAAGVRGSSDTVAPVGVQQKQPPSGSVPAARH